MSGFVVDDPVGTAERAFMCAGTPEPQMAMTNKAWVAKSDYEALAAGKSLCYVEYCRHIFLIDADYTDTLAAGSFGINLAQRKCCGVEMNDVKQVKAVDMAPFMQSRLTSVTFKLDTTSPKDKKKRQLDGAKMNQILTEKYRDHVLVQDQVIIAEFNETKYFLTVMDLEMDLGQSGPERTPRGMLGTDTIVYFDEKNTNQVISIHGAPKKPPELFKKEMNLEKLGIGGLNVEFGEIFRRAFSTRMFPPAVIQRMGIKHVKGVLLYGPPGTGKTLIARKIGEMLNAKEPKIVNGPEILNKYVGESEAKIRELFADADADMAEFGEESELHIIIFDEIDAICKQRGSGKDGTGVGDTVVNQMLSKMDGVTAINNILIVGMTNRKDMIDEALLRPGRFEVHVEIGLPDERGRHQILGIHTHSMMEHNMMTKDIDLLSLAANTKNYSGAEIEGLVKSACSYALDRKVNLDQVQSGKRTSQAEMNDVMVTKMDFDRALEEVRPAFGSESDALQDAIRHGMIDYGQRYRDLIDKSRLFVAQVGSSEKTPLMGVLFHGQRDTGKSAMCAFLAKESGFPFIKMITADLLLGYPDNRKCDRISKIFDDAHKSPRSIIILDQLERLLGYVPIGPRFSNEILQTLLVLLKKIPPKGRKLLILASASSLGILESMDLKSAFEVLVPVPVLDSAEIAQVMHQTRAFDPSQVETCAALFTEGIGIKKLLMVVEMAKQEAARKGESLISAEAISTSLMAVGY